MPGVSGQGGEIYLSYKKQLSLQLQIEELDE